MARFVALLRAVNLMGGTTLKMAVLRAMCADAGFSDVETFIASGNVVFTSPLREVAIRHELEARLLASAGRPIGVMVRSAAEMRAVLEGNPFREERPDRTVAIFLPDPPPASALEAATGRQGEQMLLGKREIYVYYDQGIGLSKLKIPAARNGTARNMNTVAKLADMAARG